MGRILLRRTILALLALALSAAAAGTPARAAGKPRGGIWAVSDGAGEIRLLWMPTPEAWPAGGWRVEDAATAAVLLPRLAAGEPAAAARLPQEDGSAIRDFEAFLADTTESRNAGYLVFALKAWTSWDFARAIGIGAVLQNVPSGPRTYRVVGLDPSGKETGFTLTSPAVDAAVASPAPPPPTGLSAAADDGVSLVWTPAVAAGQLPVVGYLVFRDGGRETNKLLTARPLVLGPVRQAGESLFRDAGAPQDEPLTYRVLGVDPFGRRSEAAVVRVTTVDRRGMLAPFLKAEAKGDRIELSWNPGKKIKRAGFVIERGYGNDGPYEPLTPSLLSSSADSWRDTGVHAGTYYFYRIRAVGPDGAIGDPSPAVRVRFRSPDPPPAPEGLAAEVGRTRVRLSWKAPTARVSGYLVERWAKGVGKWALLTARSVPETRYDDAFALHASGTYRYRVRAVGYDQQEGKPGREVEVVLPDTLGPRPPTITGIDGSDGAVELRFRPAPSDQDVDRYDVRRSDVEGEPGQVIGDALPAKAREFRDGSVVAGKRYWYRIVAFDAGQNPGEPSLPASVVVEAGRIPVPKRPDAAYRATPLPRVEITFAKPPAGLAAVVERRQDGGAWLVVGGPAPGIDRAVDLGFASGAALQYRVVYQVAGGRRGEASAPVDVQAP